MGQLINKPQVTAWNLLMRKVFNSLLIIAILVAFVNSNPSFFLEMLSSHQIRIDCKTDKAVRSTHGICFLFFTKDRFIVSHTSVKVIDKHLSQMNHFCVSFTHQLCIYA